jgi:hypothetical protein
MSSSCLLDCDTVSKNLVSADKTTHVKSAPTTLGKHKIGTMSATNADAMIPIGMENLPKFHGPGRNLLPTKKTRMKMGIVNALLLLAFSSLRIQIRGYLHKSRNRSYRKQCADR